MRVSVAMLILSAVAAAVTVLPASGAQACSATRPDALGPFYKPGAPVRSSVGEGHVLTGVVRSSPTCAAIPGASVELWLAGPSGQYDDAHIHIRVTTPRHQVLVTQYYPSPGQTAGTFDLVLVPTN